MMLTVVGLLLLSLLLGITPQQAVCGVRDARA
jgi:hypothetical protein